MLNHERGSYPSREDIIKDSVIRRVAREPRIIMDQSLRSEEWKSALLIDRKEPRVKVNEFGEILTMSYRMRRGDPEHIRIETPKKYIDIDQAIRGNAHSKDGSSEAKNRIERVLDIVEGTLEDLKVENPTKQMIITAKEKARQRLIQEGFINPETGKTKVIKPRRKTAVEQSLLRELDVDTLIAGRSLIARTVEASADANWLLELLEATFADFKAETIHNFLSRNRKDAIDTLSSIINFASGIEQNLQHGRHIIIPIQVEALQKAVRERLTHEFRPFLETEMMLRLLLLGELNIAKLVVLFQQQNDNKKRKANLQDLIEFATGLRPLNEYARNLTDKKNLNEFRKRIKTTESVARSTLSFSKHNLGRSRRDKRNPNPKFGFETEKLPFSS